MVVDPYQTEAMASPGDSLPVLSSDNMVHAASEIKPVPSDEAILKTEFDKANVPDSVVYSSKEDQKPVWQSIKEYKAVSRAR